MNGNAYGRHQASGSRSDGVSGHNTGRTAGTQTGPARATRRFSNSSITLLAASIVGLGVVCAFVAYPAVIRAETRALESGRLVARASQLESATKERDDLRARVEAARVASRAVLRAIPAQPDQASLMRMLAVETKPTVLMQTINAGDPVTASPREELTFSAVPIKVEMVATFPEIMGLLSRVEGGDRLVRPIRITLEKQAKRDNRREADWDSPFVRATIDLDAVYGSAVAARSEEKP
jgi:hypothetical protein